MLRAVLVLGLALASGAASAATLTVTVTGIEARRGGLICAAVWASAEDFLERDRRAASRCQPVGGSTSTFEFELPPGRYAALALHDENSDHELERFLGIPSEEYAFMNDCDPGLLPPDFEDVAVTLGEDGTATAPSQGSGCPAATEIRFDY
ncbi:MAG: DUF2141 domain-containing protein [Rhodospirillaceae bacterium]|nr:DUF2141 domain-containing protein [Rhodospirillaceae bacterium]